MRLLAVSWLGFLLPADSKVVLIYEALKQTESNFTLQVQLACMWGGFKNRPKQSRSEALEKGNNWKSLWGTSAEYTV